MRGIAPGLVAALWAAVAFADIFSPGDLAKPHARLEGISQCTQCHPAGGQLSQESCLSCHTELKPGVEKGLGLHGRMASDKRNCESCHADHRGAAFEMIDWGAGGQKGFDHHRSGWPLEGKHLEVACKTCHERKRIFNPTILKLLDKSPERKTMLGLPRECRSCHFDDHRGQVGDDCGACHDVKAWNPAPDFNHAETRYPLKGKHLKVKCEACHPSVRDETTPKSAFPPPVSETFLKLAPIENRSCTDCHKDPHEGKLGQRCQSCHVVEGWKLLRNANLERAFHDKTRYPLKGEHLDVACVSCHGPSAGKPAKFKGLPFAQCANCHADAHLGQMKGAAGKKREDCGSCHTVDGFMPPRFTLDQHQDTSYPLEGAHQVVACNACHLKTPALAALISRSLHIELKRKKRPELFSLASFEWTRPVEKCDSCHKDAHRGQLDAHPCASCHQLSSFKKVKLNHDRDTRYALTGKHSSTPCEKCHGAPSPNSPVQYRPLPMTCAGCHADIHAGQFAQSPRAPTECERCHETKSWTETKFLHQPPFTSYLLEGKHSAVKCEGCHRPVVLAKGLSAVRYRPLGQECESCHSDFHQGGLKGFEP